MIGADTNILARANLDDDEKESLAAKLFLSKHADEKTLFVSSYAILEFAWVLKTKGRSREEISESILDLVDAPGVVIGERDVVANAVMAYKNGKNDFGDYIILAQGEQYQTQKLATFDRKLIKENSSRCVLPQA